MLALILLVLTSLAACNDTPLDPVTGRIDTTVVTHIDTVVINGRDTIIETRIDTVIIERIDTVEITRVKRDTIRDTVEVIRTRIDTIEVPVNATRFRRAILRFQGRPDTSGLNGPLETVEVNLTDWLQYRVIDSSDVVRGIGVSISAAIPPAWTDYVVGTNQIVVDNPYRLRGLTLFIPTFRVGPNDGPFDDLPLDQHPFENFIPDVAKGGMMVSLRQRNANEPEQFWTGQVTETGGSTGGERYVNEGTMMLKTLDRKNNLITVRIEARFYLPVETSGRAGVQPFDLALDLELGY